MRGHSAIRPHEGASPWEYIASSSPPLSKDLAHIHDIPLSQMHNVNSSDEAHEPLIDRTDSEDTTTSPQTPDSHTNTSQEPYPPQTSSTPNQTSKNKEKARANRALYLLTLTAGLSGLLFGYDTGIISSTLVSIHSSLGGTPLTTWDKSLITSCTSVFALVFSPLAGYFADAWGRRPVLGVASLLFVLGAGLQAGAGSVMAMVVGRSIVGAAVGLASAIAPLFIGECAPKDARGRLVTVQSLFITGGQVVAYLVGWGVQGRWRWAVGLGAVPALLQAALLVPMDESPRWLVQRGREEQATRVLERLGGDRQEAERLVQSIREEVLEEDAIVSKKGLAYSLGELVRVPGNRRALTIACMLQGLQQCCGFNSLMYYSATIFSLVGFTDPLTTSLSIALTNFFLTLFAFALIDRIGRRRILLLSIPFMVVGLLACSLAFTHIDISTSSPSSSPPTTVPTTTPTTQASNSRETNPWPSILLTSLILYVAAYASGLGCVPWLQSELFPLSVRSLASGIATTTNWTANALTAVTFLPMMQTFGASWTFGIYAGICVVGWGVVFGIYPETSGLALEDVGGLLADGWGVWGKQKEGGRGGYRGVQGERLTYDEGE